MKAIEIPFIKFPQDWEIKFVLRTESDLFRCFIKKDGAPNVVALSILELGLKDASDQYQWETLVFIEGSGYCFGTICNCGIDDIDRLIKIIEELLYTNNLSDPSDYEEE